MLLNAQRLQLWKRRESLTLPIGRINPSHHNLDQKLRYRRVSVWDPPSQRVCPPVVHRRLNQSKSCKTYLYTNGSLVFFRRMNLGGGADHECVPVGGNGVAEDGIYITAIKPVTRELVCCSANF